MIDQILSSLGSVISAGGWTAPLISFAAGLITSVTPCSLSQLPLVLAYVGRESDTSRAFRLSLVYALGSAITFTALGIAAALLGRLLGSSSGIWLGILGVLMIMMSLQIWDIFQFIPSSFLAGRNTKRGYAGALIAGMLAGIFSSPCSTPVLVVLLTIAAADGEALWGGFLLFVYAAGVSVLAIAFGTSPSMLRKLARDERMHRLSTVLNAILGALVLAIGLYLLYLAF